MFKQISRMFGSNDPDTTEESDGTSDQSAPADDEALDGVDELAPDDEGTVDDADIDADEGPDVTELDVRVNELSDELDSTDASINELRNSQAEMADSIDEMSGRVRQLVGVYDRIAAEENPFVDDPTEATPGDTGSPMSGGDASPRGEPEANEPHARTGTPDQSATDAMEATDAMDPTDAGGENDDVVSFDDLWEESNGSASESRPPETAPADDVASTMQSADDGPLLQSIPDGYAGEVLVMEWLATLMERSGPAGAFRAVDYYENVGWISPTVERRLVDLIGGPELDVFVDPTQPREPTAEEHAISHEYLRVMVRLNEI